MNSKKSILATLSSLLLFCLVANASAGDVLTCEKTNKPARSRASVEVEDLKPGVLYTATVTSGSNSSSASQLADAFGNVEVDFDSNAKDILAGATPLTKTFIVKGTVALSVTTGSVEIVNTSATCKIR